MKTPTIDERTQFQVDRLAYFSDAVFAIAITLLALNIHAPALRHPTERMLLSAVGQMIPGIVGFVLSFLVISNYWRAHHRLFRWMRAYDNTLVTINLLLLMGVSFMPIPTAFFGDYPDFRTPLIFYAGSLALVGWLNYLLLRYVLNRPALLRADAVPAELRLMSRRSLLVPVVCGTASLFSFASLRLAELTLLLIPVFIRVYTRFARRGLSEGG